MIMTGCTHAIHDVHQMEVPECASTHAGKPTSDTLRRQCLPDSIVRPAEHNRAEQPAIPLEHCHSLGISKSPSDALATTAVLDVECNPA
jgi:hypothetical protein